MGAHLRPRLLVSLDPLLYESAIVHLLRSVDVDEVVAGSSEPVTGHFDVAIVDASGPPVDADVVIHLPGTAAADDEAVLDLTDPHAVPSRPESLLAQLDQLRPGPRPRVREPRPS